MGKALAVLCCRTRVSVWYKIREDLKLGVVQWSGVCIEFVDMSTLMSMRLNVMSLGESKESTIGFDVGQEGGKEGGT